MATKRFSVHRRVLAPNLKPADKLVYMVLASLADGKAECLPSIATLCALSGLADKTVIESVRRLEESDAMIQVIRDMGKPTRYFLPLEEIRKSKDGLSLFPTEKERIVALRDEHRGDLMVVWRAGRRKAAGRVPPDEKEGEAIIVRFFNKRLNQCDSEEMVKGVCKTLKEVAMPNYWATKTDFYRSVEWGAESFVKNWVRLLKGPLNSTRPYTGEEFPQDRKARRTGGW